MKKTLLSFAFAAFIIPVQAKRLITLTPLVSPKITIAIEKPDTNKNKIFTAVEQEPGFKGGMDKFIGFLERNLRYPADAEKNRVQGKVYITFVVEKDGKLSDIKVVRGVSRTIDAEAVRVIGMSPKWNPGIQNNRPVKVQFTIPINFVLPPLQNDLQTKKLMDSLVSIPEDQKIFTAVEQQPTFPGGIEKFNEYVSKHMRYPEEAKNSQIEGTVRVNFVIEKDGSLSDIKISGSAHSELNAEAIRLMTECPKWNPGFQNGTPRRVEYTAFVQFKLPE